MTNISTIDSGSPGRVAAVGDSTARPDTRGIRGVTVRSTDRADISPRAQLLSKLMALPAVRQDLVDRVRAEIDAGGYDTAEKLDQAMDEMIRDADEI